MALTITQMQNISNEYLKIIYLKMGKSSCKNGYFYLAIASQMLYICIYKKGNSINI